MKYFLLFLMALIPVLHVGASLVEAHERCMPKEESCKCKQAFAERIIKRELECREKMALGKYTYSKKTILKLCKTPDVRIMPIQRDAGCACK